MRHPGAMTLSRREFVRSTAAASAAVGTLELAHAAHAAGSDEIKIALVGCGGRGTGAAADALSNRTHSNVRLVALADAFAEPVERAFQDLQGQFRDKVDVPPVAASWGSTLMRRPSPRADLVLLCTPPGFRPAQFAAAVKAGKNVFMEKPVAVDAPGYRVVEAANQEAKAKGLYVAVGHHLRHAKNHAEVVRQIHDGLIGDLLYTRAYFNTQGIWNRPRQPGMTEMQYQVHNWYHFVWLSGDHIVEQHVHGIDACNWIARRPRAGHRDRRPAGPRRAGHRRDLRPPLRPVHLSDGSHSFSECRQQPGTWSNYSHHGARDEGLGRVRGGRRRDDPGEGLAAEAPQART